MKNLSKIYKVAALLGLCILMISVASANAQTYTEDFESGYTDGAQLRTHADWFYEAANSGPTTEDDVGFNSSWGLTDGDRIFTWVAHPFDWNDGNLTSVIFKMDFETDGSGHFDDDRIGWMISDTDDSSSNIFSVQMDPGGSGYCIEGYWDGVSLADRRPHIVDLPSLSANTWYRFKAEFTKLTSTSAKIDVELWSLDASGDPDTKVASGSISDTSTLGSDAPNSKYFTADTIWPAYKNFTTAAADADNAYFEIVPATPMPVISGYASESNDAPIDGVAMDANNSGGSDTTDVNGYYEISVPNDWSGTVTPILSGFTFSPKYKLYSDVTSDINDQNFTGTPVPPPPGWFEDFESGFTLGADVGTHADWFDGGNGPHVTANIGVANSIGLAPASNIFTWTAHPFDWNDVYLKSVIAQMDFQTDASAQFDDDRMGWMIRDDTAGSDYIFGVQMDPQYGHRIEGYWDHDIGVDKDKRPKIVDLPALSANAWYRLRAEFTKLTDTSAKIEAELWSLDAGGNLDTLIASGSIADTSTLGGDSPDVEYFDGTMWPAYKNYSATTGACDNANFQVVSLSPEQAYNPDPADEANDVPIDQVLSWTPGDSAVSHNVYIGTDFNDVNDANDPNVLPGRGNYDTNSYDPDVNGPELEYSTTYYWRIDEVNSADSNSPWKGEVWQFDTIVPECNEPMPGDLNGDCIVDSRDFVIMGSEWWKVGQSAEETFHFTVTADMRSEHTTFANLCEEINDIPAVGGPGEFHVSIGDVDDRIWENRTVIDNKFGSSAIWYPIIGNHEEEDGVEMEWLRDEYDSGHNGRTALKNYTNQDGPTGTVRVNYSWDHGNAHFIALNEYWDGGTTEGTGQSTAGDDTAADGDIVSELYDWLEADLNANTRPFIFVFGHEPAFPYHRHVGDSLDQYPANRNKFWSLLEKEGVTAYMCGHTHYYSKHQGDVNDDGEVWQLDAGNAGNDSGEGKQTFFDVVVGCDEAKLYVYQDDDSLHNDVFYLVETITAYPDLTHLEDFETGYTDGAELKTHDDWFYEAANSGPTTEDDVGFNSSWGLSNGDRIFTWVAHPFDWNSPYLESVVFEMDFQTSASGEFDDDRVGWMISNTDDDSSNIFGVQMDPDSGFRIEGYWDGVSVSDKRPKIVDLPTLSGSTWYRLSAKITKLTSLSAKVEAELWLLDAGGDPNTLIASGSINDTSTLGDDAPNSKYFTADTVWPAYKNFTNVAGAADNAYFEIMPPCDGLQSDINNDCIVEWKDLKALADDWLQCNLIPCDACP